MCALPYTMSLVAFEFKRLHPFCSILARWLWKNPLTVSWPQMSVYPLPWPYDMTSVTSYVTYQPHTISLPCFQILVRWVTLKKPLNTSQGLTLSYNCSDITVLITAYELIYAHPENTNIRESITVQLTSCLLWLDSAALLMLNEQQFY